MQYLRCYNHPINACSSLFNWFKSVAKCILGSAHILGSDVKSKGCLPAFEPRASVAESPVDGMHTDKRTELSRIKLKIEFKSEHSAHSTPLPIWLHPWLWRHTCFFGFNFDALATGKWYWIDRRPVVFLVECRILTQGLWKRISSIDIDMLYNLVSKVIVTYLADVAVIFAIF